MYFRSIFPASQGNLNQVLTEVPIGAHLMMARISTYIPYSGASVSLSVTDGLTTYQTPDLAMNNGNSATLAGPLAVAGTAGTLSFSTSVFSGGTSEYLVEIMIQEVPF